MLKRDITFAGADRVLAMDLHSGQCVGYFDIPVDHVYGDSVILDYLASKRISTGDLVVVSPDVGGVARARAFAKKVLSQAVVYSGMQHTRQYLKADGSDLHLLQPNYGMLASLVEIANRHTWPNCRPARSLDVTIKYCMCTSYSRR